jgi:hypothetical protein
VNFSQLSYAPLLPWAGLIAISVAAALLAGVALARRARGGVWRGAGFLLLAAILAGPVWQTRTTRPLPDIALVMVDQSQSMQLGARAAMAARALASLTASAGGTQLRVVDVPAADDGGTGLFAALGAARETIPADQLAGIVAITDGEIADAPTRLTGPPLTSLLAAKAPETDRELRLIDAPAYGLVGKPAVFKLQVLDHGVNDAGAMVNVSITADGVALPARALPVGTVVPVSLPVSHAGPAVIAAAVTPLAGEVSRANDAVAFTLNGIQKQLTILLISGSPDQGERSWRLLLKSDAAVQMVHFTILRTPGEPIDAAPDELALVPFPVRQLFETDIGKFDLIIMDRFDTTGLLPPSYLANIAAHVQSGGALLMELGPEFATPNSLAGTPLSSIMPALPADPGTITQQFTPSVTALGARHPVTAALAGMALPPWYRMEAASRLGGDVLMAGADDAPLLILAPAGQGRVGMLLSDQFWLWTRGGAHDGPALPLLRRIVHWLLREPALEAERLSAAFQGDALAVTRQTIAAAPPPDATVTAPDGTTSQLALRQIRVGQYGASIPQAARQPGVWKIAQGGFTAFAASAALNAQEFQDLAATDRIMRPLSRDVVWLGQTPRPALPQLVTPRHATAVTGTRDVPLLPPVPAMLGVLGLLFIAWWRENG